MKKTRHRLAECRANKKAKRIVFDQYILSRLRAFYENKAFDRQTRYTMYKLSHNLVNYLRTGNIGTCIDCPRYMSLLYPEKCKNKNRGDHRITHNEVLRMFKVWYTGYPRIQDYILKECFD